jgi:hypothetical protein
MFCVALTLLAIDRIDQMGERRLRWFFVAAILPAIWVNLHSLFILGLCAGGAFAAGSLVQYWMQQSDESVEIRKDRLQLALLLPVCQFIACLCNPYFLKGALFPLSLWSRVSGDNADFSDVILEFRPTLSLLGDVKEVWVFLLLSLVGIVSMVRSRRKICYWRLVVFLGFGLLSFKAARNIAWFSIAIGFTYSLNLRDRLAARELSGLLPIERTQIRIATVVSCLVLGAVCSSWWYELTGSDKRTGFGIQMNSVPQRELEILLREPGEIRVFSAMLQPTSWFQWKASDRIQCFIDPRLEVHDGVYSDWLSLSRRFKSETDNVLTEMRDRGCTHLIAPVSRQPVRILMNRSDVRLLAANGTCLIYTLFPASDEWTPPILPSSKPVGDPPEQRPVDRLLAVIDRSGTRPPRQVVDAAALRDVFGMKDRTMPLLLSAAEEAPDAPVVWSMLSSVLVEDSQRLRSDGSWLSELRLAQAAYTLNRHSLISTVLGRSSQVHVQKILESSHPQLSPMIELACRFRYLEAARQLRSALQSGLLEERAVGPAEELLAMIESDRGEVASAPSMDRHQTRR